MSDDTALHIRQVEAVKKVMSDYRSRRMKAIKDGQRPDEDPFLSIDREADAIVRAIS